MRSLIVEDDFVSRKMLQKMLGIYGECDIAANGQEAIEAFKLSKEEAKPYDLICMDIMMPGMTGQQALQKIRELERHYGISRSEEAKVIMVTALNDKREVVDAFYKGGACSYFVKPFDPEKLKHELQLLGLIER